MGIDNYTLNDDFLKIKFIHFFIGNFAGTRKPAVENGLWKMNISLFVIS